MHDDLERRLSEMAAGAPPAPEAFLGRVRRRGRRRQAALVGVAAAVIGVAGLAVVVGLPSPGRGGVGEESLPIAGDERRGLPEEAVSLVGYRSLANGSGAPASRNGFDGEPTLGRLRFSGEWADRL
ncbi:MAG TPA: hypothetical protein PLU35_06270 [Phycisphaerales bacterium]|nr:hypothetical protein [Phycisphaerales bacterium]